MSDLIERWKVLNAIDSIEAEIEDGYGFQYEKWKEHFEKMSSAEPKTEERMSKTEQNVSELDVIYRKDAIEAMSELLKRVFPEHRQIAEKCLNALPSAEPESTMGQVNDTAQSTNDCISRQAAIEGKMNLLVRCDDDKLRFKDVVPVEYLQNMPSAEPKLATDCIGRRAAIDAVYKCTDIFINNLPVMVDKADAYKALEKLPSVQPRKGKWIGGELGRCSICGHEGNASDI